MGDGNEKQEQPQVDVASKIVAGTFSAEGAAGKRTLTGDPNSPTGDEYIDHHAVCSRIPGADCFLNPESRTALIGDYKRLVSDAQNAYQRALLSIRIDELVKKDEDLPWFVALVLDVASAELLGALTRTLKELKAAELAQLADAARLSSADAAREATAIASSWYVGLSMVSDERLSSMTKSAFDVGKKSASRGVKTSLDRERTDDKSAKLSYVDELSAIATLTFEELATKPPGEATDAQLLVLWASFKPPAHSQAIYKALLEEKLKRFMNSGIRDIGRKGVALCPEVASDVPSSCSSAVPVMQDKVVVRVRFESGYPDRFAFAHKEFAYRSKDTLPEERQPETELPVDQTKFHRADIEPEARVQMQPSFERFIEPEFVDAAIERHIEVWGKAPETITADDSSWAWDQPRARRAKQNKAKEPGPFGIPRLQLASKP